MIVKRLLFLVFVMLGITAATFAVSHIIPGDPASMMVGQRGSGKTIESIRASLGLDRPIHVQYLAYIKELLRADLGISIRTQRPVADDLKELFPATLELSLFAIFISILIGVPLGIISAAKQGSFFDYFGRIISIVGVSTPVFWLGLMSMLVFYGKLGWLPGSGRIDIFMTPPSHITGFYLIDSILNGEMAQFSDSLRHLVLPSLCLAFVHLGVFARQMRASMLDVMQRDYITTARAFGIAKKSIILRHAFRNALIPTVTSAGLAIGDLLAGAVMTETIFAWPGMGSYVVDSIVFLDFPAIMGFTVVISIGYVIINLLVDISYMLLDPQIREIG